MAYKDLNDFLKKLEAEGELKRITAEISCELEITEFTDQVTKAGGPALLFENVKGHEAPVAINLFGSVRRTALALEVDDVQEIADRITGYLDFKTPQGLVDKLKMLPKLGEIGAFFPKVVKTGPCKEVVKTEGFSLFDFPVLKCWPEDAGRFITFPMVFTRNPLNGKRNVGCYRMQVFDDRTTGMHWQTQKHGADHYRAAQSKFGAGKLEVAVAIGADPATVFSSVIPAPPDMDELLLAGFLRRSPVELVKCETVDLEVPANAEIILEGYVDLQEKRMEGPFGDHTGYYSMAGDYPVFHVTCVTHRRNPVYLTTIVGPPPQEDYFMGHAVERILLPIMKLQFPEIVDVHMPAEGVFHNLMLIAIRKSYPGHARKIMSGIWGLGQAMFTKVIVVVDEDVNVQDPREVTWKALATIDPERDIEFHMGPADTLDHASRQVDYGSHMGIDATRKWVSEGYERGRWPEEIEMDPATKSSVRRLLEQLDMV